MGLTLPDVEVIWDDDQLPEPFRHLAPGAKQVARALLNARRPLMSEDRATTQTWADLVRGGLHLAPKA